MRQAIIAFSVLFLFAGAAAQTCELPPLDACDGLEVGEICYAGGDVAAENLVEPGDRTPLTDAYTLISNNTDEVTAAVQVALPDDAALTLVGEASLTLVEAVDLTLETDGDCSGLFVRAGASNVTLTVNGVSVLVSGEALLTSDPRLTVIAVDGPVQAGVRGNILLAGEGDAVAVTFGEDETLLLETVTDFEAPLLATRATQVTTIVGTSVRLGDSTDYPIVTGMAEGTEVEVTGQSGRGWLQILLPDGRAGWIPASAVSGDVSQVPAVQPPPLPSTPLPTATPERVENTASPTLEPLSPGDAGLALTLDAAATGAFEIESVPVVMPTIPALLAATQDLAREVLPEATFNLEIAETDSVEREAPRLIVVTAIPTETPDRPATLDAAATSAVLTQYAPVVETALADPDTPLPGNDDLGVFATATALAEFFDSLVETETALDAPPSVTPSTATETPSPVDLEGQSLRITPGLAQTLDAEATSAATTAEASE